MWRRLVLIALALALAALTASPAAAGVTWTLARPGARVVVDLDPFRLTFRDGRGHAVLREVPAGASLRRVPPVTRNLTGLAGPLDPPRPVLDGPLTFLVGTRRLATTGSGGFAGNLASLAEQGVEYRARRVLGIRATGRGSARIVLATTDPSGRRLLVDLHAKGGRVRVQVAASPARGVAAISDSFPAGPAERFYGLGGRHDALGAQGEDLFSWAQQENVASARPDALEAAVPGTSQDTLYPNGPSAAYYTGGSLVSSSGFGFALLRPELAEWRLDLHRSGYWQVGVSGARLDYVVAPGSGARALDRLTALTGRQPAPPAWALGPTWDREVKFPVDPPAQYAQEVQGDLRDLARYHVPTSAYRLEGWAFLPRPVLRSLIRAMRARGIHPLVYFRAFVGQDTIGTDDPRQYAYALRHGYVARRANGRPYVFTTNFRKPGAVIDFTNPAAVRWWQRRIGAALALGADGFMADFGEQVQPGMHFHDGSTGTRTHNRLPVLMARATRAEVARFERAHPGRHIFFFTRAGDTGTPGSAAYEGGNFPGDETTDWSHASGLASLATDMLSRGVGGAYGFGTDIGGYYDAGPYELPVTKELFLRWAEWAALSPLFRLHGALVAGVHTPWSYDAETLRTYIALAKLHERAAPLIRRLWQAADRTGVPVARPLWLGAPGSRALAREDQEWLLGPDVLVAPVVAPGARTRRVLLPGGCWRSAAGGPGVRGIRTVSVAAPLTRLVYFTRCGTRPFQRRFARAGAATPAEPGSRKR